MSDEPTQLFDAHTWASSALRDAPQLHPETLATVASFTFIWNLFEGVACNGRASVPVLDQIAERLEHSSTLSLDGVEQRIAFYRFRYVKDNELQQRFRGLNFRPNDRRELVEAVLKGQNTSLHATLLALLIIAYRIRNNMFHGLKSVSIWDDQARNISEAAHTLSIALEALGTDVVERARAT